MISGPKRIKIAAKTFKKIAKVASLWFTVQFFNENVLNVKTLNFTWASLLRCNFTWASLLRF